MSAPAGSPATAARDPGALRDVVIAGAGLSGLSLAAALATSGWRERSEIRPGTDRATVVVDGTAVSGRWVFDSVTRPEATNGDGYLAFTGYEVLTARPAFDPATPTLFDFLTGARFAYVLPCDHRRALVEVTQFVGRGAPVPTAGELSAAVEDYLRDLGIVGPEILRTEHAVLPLWARPADRSRGRVVAIGASAGLVKASTGYAYQRILRDSDAIVSSLTRYGHPWATRTGRWRHRLLDAVLLEVLATDPDQLRHAFGRLFTANPAERILRFLDEDTTLLAEARMVSTLPVGPYLRAAAATRRRRRPPGR